MELTTSGIARSYILAAYIFVTILIVKMDFNPSDPSTGV